MSSSHQNIYLYRSKNYLANPDYEEQLILRSTPHGLCSIPHRFCHTPHMLCHTSHGL